MKLSFDISPSLIDRIIRTSSQLKSEHDVLCYFNKVSKELENHSTDLALSPDEAIGDEIPEELRPFADALYAAVYAGDGE